MPEGPNNKITLLSPSEPTPYRVMNPVAETPIVLVCDHASCRFPESLDHLGLDPFARRCHLAVDIGAGPLTERLAESLGVTAVLAQYSRLVVDCNRQLLDPSAFLVFGDGIFIPGNSNLQQADRDARSEAIYWPYHRAVSNQINRLRSIAGPPFFVSIHSFTPVLNGVARPWEMGVLWDTDKESAQIMLEELRAGGYEVGDNEPYTGRAPQDFTVDHHAEEIGLRHAAVEIRQDLIDDDAGVEAIAALLHGAVESIVARIGQQEQAQTAQRG
jgi:predicted N-formylglutamate amidohydrolase